MGGEAQTTAIAWLLRGFATTQTARGRARTPMRRVNTFLLRAAQNQHIESPQAPQPLGKTGPQPCAVADEQGHTPHGVTTSDKPLVKRGNHPLVKPTNVPPMGMACNVQMHAVLSGVLTRHFGLVAQQNMKLRLLRLGLLRHAHDIGGNTTASVVGFGHTPGRPRQKALSACHAPAPYGPD